MLLQVIDHYENPRNVGSMDKDDDNVGTGLVGAPACGDVMKLQVGYWHRVCEVNTGINLPLWPNINEKLFRDLMLTGTC